MRTLEEKLQQLSCPYLIWRGGPMLVEDARAVAAVLARPLAQGVSFLSLRYCYPRAAAAP